MHKVCTVIERYAPLAARILLAQVFVIAGLGKLVAFPRTVAFMAKSGLPIPAVLLAVAIAVEVGGGIFLMLGWRARWAAAALLGFTLVTTLVFHTFWSSEALQIREQMNNFVKNLAIMGGLIYVIAYGAGPLSLGNDHCTANEAAAKPGKKRSAR